MAKWTAADIPSLKGKFAVVTGANSGLGLETTAGLAAKGATVVMACRDATRAQAAVDALQQRVPDAKIELMSLDLADLSSIRKFAKAVSARHPRIDLLCNNAGVMALPLCRTKDGFEMQIGTNHLGHFALTGLLLPQLQGGRVVTVASMAHRWTRGMDFDDFNWERKPYRKWDAYGKSKLANLLFTFELARRLQKAGAKLRALAAHPGYSATNLQLAGPEMEKSAIGRTLMAATNALIGQSAAMGALPTLYAAGAATWPAATTSVRTASSNSVATRARSGAGPRRGIRRTVRGCGKSRRG